MKNKLLKAIITPLLAFSVLAFSAVAINTPQKEEAAIAWSGTQTCSIQASYYSSCENLYGDFLEEALAKFNKPVSPSYDWYRYKSADEAENESGNILSLYTRHTIAKNNTLGGDGSAYAWDKWNREHIVTKAAHPLSDSDNHNIFACEGQINQIRGNLKYKQLDTVKTTVSVFDHDTHCKQSGSYFEPCDEAKGEVARAVLYVSIYYPYKITETFVDIGTCLKWHAEHPVTQREIFRNNKVYSLQGNRNPFVDHPSYANKIYDGYTLYTAPDPIDGYTPISETKVTGVSFNETTKYVAKGSSITLTPIFAPEDATNKSYEIYNSNYTILSVSEKTMTSFKVTGLEIGVAKIEIETKDGCFTAECTIIVNEDGKAPEKQNNDSFAGCHGSIIASSVLISATSLVGFVLLRIKKKKE